jgi:hypothetical protein
MIEDLARQRDTGDTKQRFVAAGSRASLEECISRLETSLACSEMFKKPEAERTRQRAEDATQTDENKKRRTTTTNPGSPTTDAEGEPGADACGAASGSVDCGPAAPVVPGIFTTDGTVDCVPAASEVTESMCLMSLKQSETLFDQLPLMPQDSGMYAILDEGCNNSVQGLRWHSRARAFLEERGLTMKLISTAKQFTFNGVGGAQTSRGCYMVPVCISGRPELCGTILSHLIDADIPLLLSRPQQSKLAVTKDISDGSVTFSGLPVDAYRTSSGLLAVSIGDVHWIDGEHTPWELYSEELILPFEGHARGSPP